MNRLLKGGANCTAKRCNVHGLVHDFVQQFHYHSDIAFSRISMRYVDGFVIVLPKKNVKAYIKMAKEGCKAWMKFGALDYMECLAEDMQPKHVTRTFPIVTKAKPGDTIIFAFIVFKSRKHRDSVNKKVMAYFDKMYKDKNMEMPFSMKQFSYGGFKTVVHA